MLPGKLTCKGQYGATAYLAALCLMCASFEFLIPKPVPFIRLGLANIPILLALPLLQSKYYFLLLALKAFGQALINGTLVSHLFIFSLSGTVTSGLIMLFIWRLIEKRANPSVSFIGISIIGGLCSNAAQIAVASLILFGPLVKPLIIPILATGLIASAITGWIATWFSASSQWYRHLETYIPETHSIAQQAESWMTKTNIFPLITGLFMVFGLLFQHSLFFLAIEVILIILLSCLRRNRFRILPNLMLIIGVTLIQLIQPIGQVWFLIGSWAITKGALLAGLQKSLYLIGLVYISRYITAGTLLLPGKFGKLIAQQLSLASSMLISWHESSSSKLSERIDTMLITSGNTTALTKDAPIPVYTTILVILVMVSFFFLS